MSADREFHRDGSAPAAGQVFVFGSNQDGAHLGGAARAAFEQYGADWGMAEGRTGHCYAIPTVASGLIAGALSLEAIQESVKRFLTYAVTRPHLRFFVTRVGCGIAGHRDKDIAPMFAAAPANCSLPDTWVAILVDNHKE